MKEKPIENDIKKFLRKKQIYFFKNHGNMLTEPGRPDIVACVNGKFVGIEVKRLKGGIQSDAQKFHEDKIKKNNGIYLLTNNLKEVEVLIDEIIND